MRWRMRSLSSELISDNVLNNGIGVATDRHCVSHGWCKIWSIVARALTSTCSILDIKLCNYSMYIVSVIYVLGCACVLCVRVCCACMCVVCVLYVCACIRACIYVYMLVCVCVCVCVHACTCVWMCVHMCVYLCAVCGGVSVNMSFLNNKITTHTDGQTQTLTLYTGLIHYWAHCTCHPLYESTSHWDYHKQMVNGPQSTWTRWHPSSTHLKQHFISNTLKCY